MVNNCHIHDLVQALSYVNGGLILILWLVKPLTFKTVASSCILLTKQTDTIGMSKVGVQQSSLCYNMNYNKNKQICNKEEQKGIYKVSFSLFIFLC